MPLPSLSKVLGKVRTQGLRPTVDYAIHRLHAGYWERRLGIHTTGSRTLAEDGIVSEDGHFYSAESYLDFERSLRWLSAEERRGAFLDCGSGKGRIVLRAACEPFSRALGVELSPTLTEAARRNLEAARPRLVCRTVEFALGDAAEYPIPVDVTCLFLYNPFGGAVLDRVLGNVRSSLETQPRPFAMIVATPDRVIRALDGAAWIRMVDDFHGLRRHVLYRRPTT